MSARGDSNFMRYVYMGQEGEIIPLGATHIIVHESVTVIRTWAFHQHPNIVEIICHEKVEKIEEWAFYNCPSLRRVIMSGVTIVEQWAFYKCIALTDVECGKLEIIGEDAFCACNSLESINLSSARILEASAFSNCTALMDVKFGSKLERIGQRAFGNCPSLEQITIPLRDGMVTDDTFGGCAKLMQVDLVEREILRETITALHLEEWRNDMNEEMGSINQILPTADAGYYNYDEEEEEYAEGEKAQAIRTWIRSLLGKIMDYKAEHRRLLDEDVVPTLQQVLPQDIVMNSVLPFLYLPPFTFEVGDHNN